MVEGHSVHRIASRFRQKLVGKRFTATSPNGRFAEGAEKINGRVFSNIEAVGKNLFVFFSSLSETASNSEHRDDDLVVVHVHFGMSGVWALHDSREEPKLKPTHRLRLVEQMPTETTCNNTEHNTLVAHLSCMTLNHGSMNLFQTKRAALGEDPLRLDANPDALYNKITGRGAFSKKRKSSKCIGALVMDQSYFAGPGNIYRAEILFMAGIHPSTPGVALNRPAFDRVWESSVKLLRRGYDTGSILTVDPVMDPELSRRRIRRYIYNRSSCARCGGPVASWTLVGRTCYACEGGCQKLLAGAGQEIAKDSKTVQKVENQQHTPFISHCAPDKLETRLVNRGPHALTIKEIRLLLETMGGADNMPLKSAKKAVHVEALADALSKQQNSDKAIISKQDPTKIMSSTFLPPPIISAEDAAREKTLSGENRAVEHVAELSTNQALKAIGRKTAEVNATAFTEIKSEMIGPQRVNSAAPLDRGKQAHLTPATHHITEKISPAEVETGPKRRNQVSARPKKNKKAKQATSRRRIAFDEDML